MYPLKFQPILKSTLWGGEKIIPFKHLDSNQTQVGESWEISDVPGDESIVANGADAGKNLTQMVNEYKGALVGEANYKRFNGKFPLLIKKPTTNASTANSRCSSNSSMPSRICPSRYTRTTNWP